MKFLSILFLFMVNLAPCLAEFDNQQQFIFKTDTQNYPYEVKATGINYNFQFESKPIRLKEQKLAGLHVLNSIYQDDSIDVVFSKGYKKERAKCHAIESRFHTYTLCFLPNDFTKDKQDRFWGFVTRVPNWFWQITHVLLPVGMLFLLFYYWFRPVKTLNDENEHQN